jgi:G:T-mismatch repair DNA endonuclease (very short patch repair protein)
LRLSSWKGDRKTQERVNKIERRPRLARLVEKYTAIEAFLRRMPEVQGIPYRSSSKPTFLTRFAISIIGK